MSLPRHASKFVGYFKLLLINSNQIFVRICVAVDLFIKKKKQKTSFAGIQETLRILDSGVYSAQKSFQLLYFLLYLFHLF